MSVKPIRYNFTLYSDRLQVFSLHSASGRIWNLPVPVYGGVALENRHNRTVIGAVDVILDLVAGQGSVQRLNSGVVLAAFLHNQYVGVGLGSLGGSILGSKSVLADGEAGLHCVVAVDDGEVNILHGAGQLGSLDLLDLQVVRVVGDVVDRSGQTGAVADGDQALGGQQLQSAGLVG